MREKTQTFSLSQARASVEVATDRTLRLSDIQALLLWVLADGINPRWAFLKHTHLVHRVLVIGVPGLGADVFAAARDRLPRLASLGPPAPCLAHRPDARPSAAVAALFGVPRSRKRKREADAERKAACGELPPPAAYALDRAAAAERDYPLHHLDANGDPATPPGYVSTRGRGGGGAPTHALVAVDCEMCITTAGYELARVSAVGADGSVLLDRLVAPANPVVDYNTRFSGIDETTLAGVTTTLADAQAAMLDLVHEHTVLIGHALENDLRALRLLHERVVDTGVLFPHPRGPPFRTALRRLTEKFLKRTIQAGSKGHDSVDDARAAMDLALLKFRRGPDFGVADGPPNTDKLAAVLTDAGKRAIIVDRPDAVNRHVGGSADGVPVASDGEAAARAARAAGMSPDSAAAPHFVWTRLAAIAALQDARADAARAAVAAYATAAEADPASPPPLPPLADGCPPPAGTAPEPPPPSLLNTDEYQRQMDAALAAVDRQIGTLIDGALPNTLIVVATLHGDTANTRRLQEQAYRRARGLDGLPPWSVAAEAHLAAVRERGLRGLVFCDVKQ